MHDLGQGSAVTVGGVAAWQRASATAAVARPGGVPLGAGKFWLRDAVPVLDANQLSATAAAARHDADFAVRPDSASRKLNAVLRGVPPVGWRTGDGVPCGVVWDVGQAEARWRDPISGWWNWWGGDAAVCSSEYMVCRITACGDGLVEGDTEIVRPPVA